MFSFLLKIFYKVPCNFGFIEFLWKTPISCKCANMMMLYKVIENYFLLRRRQNLYEQNFN